ncbi:hypothetical protein D3C86_2193530 [compost metagenome]
MGSQYFLAYSEVRQGERRLRLASTLQREINGQVRVLYRDLGLPPRLFVATDDNEG